MWSTVQVGTSTKENGNNPCQSPSSRSKHAMCATQNGVMYLLGGRSANLPLKDLWRFDPVQSHWEEMRCRGNRPPCLQEHTMVAWKNMLYVFGGEIGFASTGETPLWILDLGTSTWRKHHVRGLTAQQPSGRRGHTAVVYNGAMHVYGGYQDLRGSSSELWTFDFATERWQLTLLGNQVEQPPPRHNHSCVVHDGCMWVYGGLTDLQTRGDFWKWDFVGHQWSRVKSQRGPGEIHGHASVKAMAYMYIFGGERSGILLNELWRYHFATDLWEKIQTEGVMPNPRARHVALTNPVLQNWDASTPGWESNTSSSEHERSTNSSGGGNKIHDKTPLTNNPPKSISMCFGQGLESENGRKHFRFRVRPMSRLCSKNTSSDGEDDDEEYTVSYSTNTNAQVNVSKSLREKISSSRLVRSISSGSYSILHNQNMDPRPDELERLVEESTPQQQRVRMQKSHSSDAVLESDSESATPQHKPRPHSENLDNHFNNSSSYPERYTNGHPSNIFNINNGNKDNEERVANGEICCCHSNGTNTRLVSYSGQPQCDSCRHSNPASTRASRLAYDGPLSTVRDVEEENSELGDGDVVIIRKRRETKVSSGAILIDLDSSDPSLERTRSARFTSSATLSDLASQTCTPSVESRGLPHSVSHSSGYHSFTDEEGGFECHREFACCLNPAASRKASLRTRDLELKTFTPTHQGRTLESEEVIQSCPVKERARSWDRASQRKQIRSYPSTVMPCKEETQLRSCSTHITRDDTVIGQSPSRMWSRSPAKPRIEQHNWQLCLYVFGGREQTAPGVYRQPISVWKLYI